MSLFFSAKSSASLSSLTADAAAHPSSPASFGSVTVVRLSADAVKFAVAPEDERLRAVASDLRILRQFAQARVATVDFNLWHGAAFAAHSGTDDDLRRFLCGNCG